VGLGRREIIRIAESVGERSGWDFARVRSDRDPTPWNYNDVAGRYVPRQSHVLDIGTGGGEILLGMAAHFRSGIGIDLDPEMIEQANRNLHEGRAPYVRFMIMDAHDLQFADATFDAVLNRHCNVDVMETARVLRSGGVFVTQQVGQNNSLNILHAFGWTPASFGRAWWQPVSELGCRFCELGFHIEVQAEYDVPYWFRDLPSLVFWLKSVPLPEVFDPEKHWRGVKAIVEKNSTSRGIRTNEHRELLVVRKPV